MNLYYAVGGGLGHLTRARTVLRQLDIEKNSLILTASEFADDNRVTGDIGVIKVRPDFARDQRSYQKFLCEIFARKNIENFFLDAFPIGVLGEFADFDFGKTNLFYLARLLKWNVYADLLAESTINFQKIFVLEELTGEHQKFVDERSNAQVKLELKYLIPAAPHEKAAVEILNRQQPYWIVVHAGGDEETNELLKFAEEMREIENAAVEVLVISTVQSAKLNYYNIYPAAALFPSAARIITAGGFNAVEQTKEFRRKHFAVPFERRFDNQFLRVARL